MSRLLLALLVVIRLGLLDRKPRPDPCAHADKKSRLKVTLSPR